MWLDLSMLVLNWNFRTKFRVLVESTKWKSQELQRPTNDFLRFSWSMDPQPTLMWHQETDDDRYRPKNSWSEENLFGDRCLERNWFLIFFTFKITACDACKRLHKRCDGSFPVCGRCSNLDKKCIYSGKKKSGPPKGKCTKDDLIFKCFQVT